MYQLDHIDFFSTEATSTWGQLLTKSPTKRETFTLNLLALQNVNHQWRSVLALNHFNLQPSTYNTSNFCSNWPFPESFSLFLFFSTDNSRYKITFCLRQDLNCTPLIWKRLFCQLSHSHWPAKTCNFMANLRSKRIKAKLWTNSNNFYSSKTK